MDSKRFKIGVSVSILWALFGLSILFWSGVPKDANSWGDYFAGVFAPLAFLWLVLGYMQQGEELRLQAEELRKSVEHQGAMAEVARSQLEDDRNRARAAEDAARLANLPDIRVGFQGAYASGIGTEVHFSLHNTGGSLRDLAFFIEAKHSRKLPRRLMRGDSTVIEVVPHRHEAFTMKVSGRTALDEVIYLKSRGEPIGGGAFDATPFELISQEEWEEPYKSVQ